MKGSVPLKFPRLISLFLAWAWSLISIAMGINAFVRTNKEIKHIRSEVPAYIPISFLDAPIAISINTNDVVQASAVTAAVAALILVLTTIYIVLMVVGSNGRSGISTRTLPVQYISLGFLSLALLATEIPVTLFVWKRSAKVSVSIGDFDIPSDTLSTIEQAMGVQTAYKSFSFLKLFTILSWATVFFTFIAAIVSFLASLNARRNTSRGPPLSSAEPKAEPKAEASTSA
ncbi:hypothetical protein K438DRAFT_1835999 [Mycena galopus ATCC 62051]|nr:hypothetical protein K438DRAFT_1835999 [Mycena galopus ATCC 62051]